MSQRGARRQRNNEGQRGEVPHGLILPFRDTACLV